MTLCLLPVTALWLGMRATIGVGALLAPATLVISLAHGDPPRDTVQWLASVIGGDAFLLSVSRALLQSRAAAEALRIQAHQADQLAAARERARIAADLHDGQCHHRSAARVQLEADRATRPPPGRRGPPRPSRPGQRAGQRLGRRGWSGLPTTTRTARHAAGGRVPAPQRRAARSARDRPDEGSGRRRSCGRCSLGSFRSVGPSSGMEGARWSS